MITITFYHRGTQRIAATLIVMSTDTCITALDTYCDRYGLDAEIVSVAR